MPFKARNSTKIHLPAECTDIRKIVCVPKLQMCPGYEVRIPSLTKSQILKHTLNINFAQIKEQMQQCSISPMETENTYEQSGNNCCDTIFATLIKLLHTMEEKIPSHMLMKIVCYILDHIF
jgi:hypothetical protein